MNQVAPAARKGCVRSTKTHKKTSPHEYLTVKRKHSKRDSRETQNELAKW